jgi:hypothetical protein
MGQFDLEINNARFDTHKASLHHENERSTKQNPNLVNFSHKRRYSLDVPRGLVPSRVFQ